MAQTITMHGLRLANGSYVENLHIERLATDPVPVSAGRMWFNTTDKAIKYSSLDVNGGVIVRTIKSAEDIDAAVATINSQLADIQTQLDNGNTALQNALNAEVSRATAAEAAALASANAYIDAQVSSLVNGAPALLDTLSELATALRNNPDIVAVLETKIGDDLAAAKAELKGTADALNDTMGELADRIGAEEVARSAADATEVAARVAGDSGLDDRLSTVEGQVNGKIGNLADLTTTDKSNIVAATNEVVASVSSEKSRAQGAENTLTVNLAAEVTRATAAEGAIQTALDASIVAAAAALASEAAARTAADTAEADARIAAVTAETDARVAAVTAESDARTAADTAEAAARTSADDAIKASVNAGKFTFQAGAAAVEHTITHNLNSAFVLYTVMTEGTDGKYRNDIVPVEEIDLNTMKVYLSESRKIKVSVQSMASI